MSPKTSSVWKYFTVCPAPNEHLAECKVCDDYSRQRYFSRGKNSSNFSTKPLWRHLQCKHPIVFQELQKGQTVLPTIASSWSLSPQSQHQAWKPNEAKLFPESLAVTPESVEQSWEVAEAKYFLESDGTAPQLLQYSGKPKEMRSLNIPKASVVAPFTCE